MYHHSKKSLFFCFFSLFFFYSNQGNTQVIISKVFANNSFELKNMGNTTVDISTYWICDFPKYRPLSTLTIECGNMNLAAGSTIVFNDPMGLHDIADSELGLYTTNAFGDANALISYVEWGSSAHQRSGLATRKGIWDGMRAPAFTTTQSLELNGAGTKAADWGVNTTPQKCQVSRARYRVTFNATWSSSTHPTDFPRSAHFSGLIGMSHNGAAKLFEMGKVASSGIASMAETGSKSALTSEINNFIGNETGLAAISGGGISISPGSVSVEFDIENFHPLVSLTTMIAPSPDWFVGVNGISLLANGDWVNQKTVHVGTYDAGSDSGANFTSPNQSTNPLEPVTMITTPPLATNGVVPSMGTMTFQRIDGGNECIANRVVSNTNASGNFLASKTLNTTMNNPVEITTSATFKAGTSITLNTGFHAKNGSSFLAAIKNCASSFTVPTANAYHLIATEISTEKILPSVEKKSLKIAPNPFVGNFTIEYFLPKADKVSIQIVDKHGRMVEMVKSQENANNGYHQLTMEVSHLPTGMYFVVLQTTDEVLVQRGVLLK